MTELSVRSKVHDLHEDWKPAFLSNEEFMHLTLEAFDGFIIVFSSSGRILYTSGNITSLLGYLPVRRVASRRNQQFYVYDDLRISRYIMSLSSSCRVTC